MNARKPATKTSVAAARITTKTASVSHNNQSKSSGSTNSGTVTARFSSSTPHFEEVARPISVAPQSSSLTKRDSLPEAIARSYEALQYLYRETESLDYATQTLCSTQDEPGLPPPEFHLDSSVLGSINQITAHINRVASQLETLRGQLDI